MTVRIHENYRSRRVRGALRIYWIKVGCTACPVRNLRNTPYLNPSRAMAQMMKNRRDRTKRRLKLLKLPTLSK